MINAAEYGNVQRRRRTFIFAYHKDTKYAEGFLKKISVLEDGSLDQTDAARIVKDDGFFAKTFPVKPADLKEKISKPGILSEDIVDVSDHFAYSFDNSGFMLNGWVYTMKTKSVFTGHKVLGDILESRKVDDKYFVPEERLYYTKPEIDHSDETEEDLPREARQTWQYIKGAKKRKRTAVNGHEYVFSEGPVAMIDDWNAPARTMLTSEGTFNRSTHIVKDKVSGGIRILTPIETERIQGFPDDWTKECLIDGKIIPMNERMRYFCMGNALVVDLVARMEIELSEIFDREQ